MLNKANLIKVRNTIIAHNEQFNYQHFIGSNLSSQYATDTLLDRLAEHECDTTACVAGWSTLLAKQEGRPYDGLISTAREWLGLNRDDMCFLFYTESGHGEPELLLSEATWHDAVKRLNILIDLAQ